MPLFTFRITGGDLDPVNEALGSATGSRFGALWGRPARPGYTGPTGSAPVVVAQVHAETARLAKERVVERLAPLRGSYTVSDAEPIER